MSTEFPICIGLQSRNVLRRCQARVNSLLYVLVIQLVVDQNLSVQKNFFFNVIYEYTITIKQINLFLISDKIVGFRYGKGESIRQKDR